MPFITKPFQWRNGVVTDLGALPGETDCSEVLAINNAGVEVGTSENGEFDPFNMFNKAIAVRWINGRIEAIGGFGGDQNAGTDINDRGQIVGESQNTIPDQFGILFSGTQLRAFLWQDGKMRDLGTLGGNDSFANSINQRGQIVGISYATKTANADTGIPTLDPFIWDNGKMTDLGTLGGKVVSNRGIIINNREQVVGASSTAANPGACSTEFDPNCHVFLWHRGSLTDLTTNSRGGQFLGASKITDDGWIVGNAFFSVNRPTDAAVWRNGTVTDVGNLGDCFSYAHDINARHQIVGGTFTCNSADPSRAFLWENGSMQDLNLLVAENAPLRLIYAEQINDRGEIVGEGVPPGIPATDVSTRGHAFVLVPIGGEQEVSGVAGTSTAAGGHVPTTSEIAAFHRTFARLHHHFGVRIP